MFDSRLAVILGAGEHIYQQTAPGQLPAKVTHIDIHATRFFAAKQGQRTGVDAEDGDAVERGWVNHKGCPCVIE
jgi:hypothetical protein